MNSPSAPRPAATDLSPAQRVADAVLDVPGVVDLHSGPFGQLATYLPGGRVRGVVLEDTTGSVHVVVNLNYDLRAVAEEVLRVAEIESGVAISVVVEDVATGASQGESAAGQELTAQQESAAQLESTVQQQSRVKHDG